MIEDHGGWVYQDRSAYELYHREGDQTGILQACEWRGWNDSEEWARGLSVAVGSLEYWHSGGGIWLAFYTRPDGRFAVIGSESVGIYANREEFEADEFGEKANNYILT